MRDARIPDHYGLAVCAFNSFPCLTSPDDVLAFLHNASEHLAPDGLLGIEVSTFRPKELAGPPDESSPHHELIRPLPNGGRLERFRFSRYDAPEQLLSMTLFYELYDGAGVLAQRRSHGLKIRVITRDEQTLMLRLAGFAVESVYGGFDGEPFIAESEYLIVLARGIAESEYLIVLARGGGPPPA